MGLGAGDNFKGSFHEAGAMDNTGDTKKVDEAEVCKLFTKTEG